MYSSNGLAIRINMVTLLGNNCNPLFSQQWIEIDDGRERVGNIYFQPLQKLLSAALFVLYDLFYSLCYLPFNNK